jgi:D-3-phosphoglycerate dehydrogenase
LKNNILIVDDLHPAFIEQAESFGYTINYQPDMKLDEAYAIINNYDGLVIRSKFPGR